MRRPTAVSPGAAGSSSSASRRCCSRSRSPSSCWPWPRSAPNIATAPPRAPIRSPASPTAAASSNRPRSSSARRWTSSRRRVLLFDLDHFKSINDRYGHAIGDRALQIFADTAKSQYRSRQAWWDAGAAMNSSRCSTTPPRDRAATLAEHIQRRVREGGRRHRRPPGQGDGQHRHGVLRARGRSNCRRCCCRPIRRSTAPRRDGRNRLAVATPRPRRSASTATGLGPAARRPERRTAA